MGNESRGATRRGLKDSTAVIAARVAPRPENSAGARYFWARRDADFGAAEEVRPVPEPKRGGPRYGNTTAGQHPLRPAGVQLAGNRIFFYRVHQGLRCLLTRAGSAFEVLVEETDDPCAGVGGGRLVEA